MSSSSENDSGAEEDTINGDVANGGQHAAADEESNSEREGEGRIVELLREEQEDAPTPPQKLGNGTNRYRATEPVESASEDGSMDTVPRRAASPIESLLSIPDDSPSVQVGQVASYLCIS